MNVGETSSLVAIVGTLILVESEVAILSLIDVETDGTSRLLVTILQSGTEGDDGATGHEDGYLLVGSGTDAGLATFGGDATIVEVVPDAAFGEIDVALACLVLIDRTNHERGTEHELIAQVEHLGVVAEVHHEGTQHSVVVEMNLTCQRVDVGHHAIAELDAGTNDLVGGMRLGSDVPRFAEGELAVYTVHGCENTPLVPAHIEFAPVAHVLVFASSSIKEVLCCLVTLLNRETADVLAPIRNARDGEVKTSGDLCLHILPAGADVARPSGSRESLLGSKPVTREEEDTLVVGREGIFVAKAILIPLGLFLECLRIVSLDALTLDSCLVSTLTVVDGLSIDDGIGVEILVARAEGGGTAEQFAIRQVGAVAHIGLGGIHPPGVHADDAEFLVELTPEHLACIEVVGIVEGIFEAQPVVERILDALLVDLAHLVKLLHVVGGQVVLGPTGDHDLGMLGMDGVDHTLGIVKAKGVEGECAPRVGTPVVPVHDDVVDRQLAVAEALECIENLALTLVALAALPEAEEPLRHDLRLAGESAIALDHLITVVACDEVIVKLLHHLAPETEFGLLLGKDRCQGTESAIGFTTIGGPFETELVALAGLHANGKLAGIGVPGGTPDGLVALDTCALHILGIDVAVVDVDPLIAAVVMTEVVFAGHTRHDLALEGHLCLIERVFWQVLGRSEVLEIDAVLTTYECLLAWCGIGTSKRTCNAILVVEVEEFGQLAVVLGVAEAHQRIAIDKHAIVAARNDEWNGHLGVVLEKLLVLALVVPVVGLMLTEAIECLIGRAFEDNASGPSLPSGGIGHFCRAVGIGRPNGLRSAVGCKGLAALGLFGKNDITLEVGEPHLAVALKYIGHDEGGLYLHGIATLDGLVLDLLVLRHDDERRTIGKLVFGRSRNANDLLAHHFKTDEAGAIGGRLFDANCNLLTLLAHGLAPT